MLNFLNDMQQIVLRIVGAVILVIVILLGIYEVISLNKTISNLETQNVELVNKVESVNKIKEANEKLLKEEVAKAKQATEDSIKIQNETNKKYNQTRTELVKVTADYSSLVNNGYRLRDTFTNNSDRVQTSTSRGVAEGDSTAAIISDRGTSVPELSRGLSEYLGTRTLQADAVVKQLQEVQEYAKMQHQWILNNCNAKEYTK